MIRFDTANWERPLGVVFQCEFPGGENDSPSYEKGLDRVSLCPVDGESIGPK